MIPPCKKKNTSEACFGYVKDRLRYSHIGGTLVDNISFFLSSVERKAMEGWYLQAIFGELS